MVAQWSCPVLVVVYWMTNVVACIGHTGHKPLILTPFLEDGELEKARNMSLTTIDDIESYSGYFNIDKNCSSNLFFWFFQTEEDPSNASVLVWLQGGPGSTSMFGLFQENGPWSFSKTTGLKKRRFSWTKKHNVLYLDQPAGTGFSYSEKNCYPTELTMAAKQVTVALSQFFMMFPGLRKNKLFLTGESYSGHTIPAIAVEIDKQNIDERLKEKINLVGIIVGSPFLDYTCIDSITPAYELGIIDSNDRDEGIGYYETFIQAVHDKNFTQAREQIGLLYSVIDDGSLRSLYNVLYDDELKSDFIEFLNNSTVKRQLHVSSQNFTVFNRDVYNALYPQDAFVSIAPSLEYLLDTGRYILGFYSGQLDLVCPYTSLTCTLERLKWSGALDYHTATRRPWYVSGRLASWVKVSGNLFEVAVRHAGHYVPRDQGEVALELISAAVSDTPGSTLLTELDYGTPDDDTSTMSRSLEIIKFLRHDNVSK